MPVVGYLYLGTPEMSGGHTSAFRKGLSEAGFVEGRNVAIEYRYGNNQAERFPELAAELVRRRVAVIAAMGSSAAALAAKNSTTTIPVIFETGADPVQLGLVASLNRPGGNVTGISSMNAELAPKRLGLLHELLPKAARFGLLSYPTPATEQTVAELRAAATTLGVALEVLQVFTNRDIDAAIEGVAEKRIDALIVSPTPFFSNRRVQLATLAARYAVPMVYSDREIVEGAIRLMAWTCFARLAFTLAVCLRGKSLPTCRCFARLNLNSSSISTRPSCFASTCRRPCSPSPTR
jgi:putative ABC transport system substrate-binding protein